MFTRGLVRRYKCHISWRVCNSGISWWVCKSAGYPGVCARAGYPGECAGAGYPDGCARVWYPVVCARAGYPGVCEGAGCPGGCAGAGYPDRNPARLAVLGTFRSSRTSVVRKIIYRCPWQRENIWRDVSHFVFPSTSYGVGVSYEKVHWLAYVAYASLFPYLNKYT